MMADVKLREDVRRSESICAPLKGWSRANSRGNSISSPGDGTILVQPTVELNHFLITGLQNIEDELAQSCTETLTLDMGKEELIRQMTAGNQRYVKSQPKKKGGGSACHRAELAHGQAPPVALIGCADSRVPPELVFDADAGELFTVRVAGNVVSPDNLASLEYAVKCLGTKLVIVLGHTRCGAVAAACGDQSGLVGHLPMLMHQIRPHVQKSQHPVHDNVRAQLEKLEASMGNFGQDSGLQCVGAVFNIDTGVVEWL
jgi:carbonic anhydrase